MRYIPLLVKIMFNSCAPHQTEVIKKGICPSNGAYSQQCRQEAPHP